MKNADIIEKLKFFRDSAKRIAGTGQSIRRPDVAVPSFKLVDDINRLISLLGG